MSGCRSGGIQSEVKQQKPSVDLKSVTVNPVELLDLLIVLNGIVIKYLFDTGAERCFISLIFIENTFGKKVEIFKFCCPFCRRVSLCQ